MKNKQIDFDKRIAGLVSGIEQPVPAKINSRIKLNLEQIESRNSLNSKFLFWLPASVLAAAAVFLLLISPGLQSGVNDHGIKEIRTYLVLKDKKIKILWFHKTNFNLNRRK